MIQQPLYAFLIMIKHHLYQAVKLIYFIFFHYFLEWLNVKGTALFFQGSYDDGSVFSFISIPKMNHS